MKFKLDENLPSELREDLRALGHEAETVVDEGLTGAPDSVILARVRSERRVLITMDKGIADVRAYPPGDYSGIVLLRPLSTGRRSVLEFARRHLEAILQNDLEGRLLVVTDRTIRLR